MSDGWEDVNDPAEMRKVLGAKAVPAPSANPTEPQLTGDARNQALQKIAALKLLREQTERVAREFDTSQNGSGVFKSLSEYVPAKFSDSNSRFDKSVSGLVPLARAAFRVPGSGADSDKESDAFMGLLPSRWTRDAGNLQSIKQMKEIIDSSTSEQRALLGIPAAPAKRMFGGAKTLPARGPAKAPQSKVIDWSHLPE